MLWINVMTHAPEGMHIIHISHEELIYFSTCLFTISFLIYCKWYEVNWYDFINVIICMHITLCVSLNTCVRCAAERMPFPYPCPCSTANTYSLAHMMTSSNGNIFRVTGPLCGEITGPGDFPTQRPVMRSFGVFFDLRLNKRLSKQPWGWWFETPSLSLWRQRNEIMTYISVLSQRGQCSLK